MISEYLSPTTSKKRMKNIIKDSHDMIYYISMLSTTGGKLKVSPKKIINWFLNIQFLIKRFIILGSPHKLIGNPKIY